MTDANREARILELRRLVAESEYHANPEQIASLLIDEHLHLKNRGLEEAEPGESELQRKASAS
jgi:hypothetical protein